MQVIGIVAEYNPFHTGHAYQIRESRRLVGAGSAVAATGFSRPTAPLPTSGCAPDWL